MPLTPPTQDRAIDAFSQYRFSQNLNLLSRAITQGRNVIQFPDLSFNLTKLDWSLVDVSPGIAFKDDVLIHIKQTYELDFADNNYYIDPSGQMDNEGYYFIVLQYYYARSLPAPKAFIKIIRDVDTYYYPYMNDLIFLGSAQVSFNHSLSRYEVIQIVKAVDIHATIIGTNTEMFTIDSNHNSFHLKVNDDERTIELAMGPSISAVYICAEINNAFYGNSPAVATPYGLSPSKIKLTAPLVGINSSIFLYASNSTANIVLGFIGSDSNAIIGQLTPPYVTYEWGEVDGGWVA